MEEHLPSKCEDLSLVSSTERKIRQKKKTKLSIFGNSTCSKPSATGKNKYETVVGEDAMAMVKLTGVTADNIWKRY